MKPFRILLVDQNGTDLEYVTRSLMNLGAGSPVIARNESEALDDIDKRNPELVILNLINTSLIIHYIFNLKK